MTDAPISTAGSSALYDLRDGSYIFTPCGMDIDGDGSGGNAENDPDWQSTTTFRHPDGFSCNARIENGFVIPEHWVRLVPGAVMGCRGEITDYVTSLTIAAVPLDAGPTDRAGEAFIATAKLLGVPSSPLTGGTQLPRFSYRFWPGQPGWAAGKSYTPQRMRA